MLDQFDSFLAPGAGSDTCGNVSLGAVSSSLLLFSIAIEVILSAYFNWRRAVSMARISQSEGANHDNK